MLFTNFLLLHSVLSLVSTQPVHPSDTTITTSPQTYLTVPALITHNNATKIQCWRLRKPFMPSTTEGMNGLAVSTIANTTSLTYVVAPPHSDGSVHNAPAPQLVHILSGVVHITLPQDPNSDLWVVGGKGGLIIATDITGLGHGSSYPSDMETVAIMAPFAGGRAPEHEVIGEGACLGEQTFV